VNRLWSRLSRTHVTLAGAGALLIVLLVAWGVSGALRMQAVRYQIEAAEHDIATLRARAALLTQTIDRLRNDPAYIEKLAREEHGLVREGETVLKFPSKPK
jgi:cell division protein FtsB